MSSSSSLSSPSTPSRGPGKQDLFCIGAPFNVDASESEAALADGSGPVALRDTWSEPPGSLFDVRGPAYLSQTETNVTHLKQKSADALYECVGTNFFKCLARIEHSALNMGPLRRFLEEQQQEADAKGEPADASDGMPRFLVVCWLFSSFFGKDHTLVQHVYRRKGASKGADKAADAAFARFRAADPDSRNAHFKYMFRMVDAPPSIKSAVSTLGGERPVIIGKRLTTTYFEGQNYLEINMDVGSSYVASTLNSLILKTVGTAVLDCAWLLEGQKEEELPERVLATVRWNWCDPNEITVVLDGNGDPVEAS